MNTYAVYEVSQAIRDCIDLIEQREEELYEAYKYDYADDGARAKAKEQAYEEGKDTLELLKMEKADLLSDMVDEYRNLQTLIAGIDAEKKILESRKDRLAARQETAKKIIEMLSEGQKIETEHFKLSYRKSEKTVITDINHIPKDYIKAEMTIPAKKVTKTLQEFVKDWKADKTAIKKAIKAGEDIPGAEIEVNNNLSIQ